MKRGIIIATASLIFILSLVIYNYFVAQKAISEEKTSITRVVNVSYPESVEIGSQAPLVWRVEVPEGLRTPLTTIYWGYQSSPSALMAYDSPLAVGYPNHPGDYESGEFLLPSDFSISIEPTEIGQVFFRSYAFVQNRHLWSEELSFTVIPKTNGQ